jgi:CheY-like chemotaxis protein
MVIDDNAVDLYLAREFIGKCNFSEKVISMQSAKAALEYLESFANSPEKLPGLIFLDIKMPEIDGFGFLEQFEHLPSIVTSATAIMMLSSSNDPYDIERAESNPFVKKFITKPVNKEKLHEITARKMVLG